jgi:hypothetical protein
MLNLSYLQCDPSHGTNKVHFFLYLIKKGKKSSATLAYGQSIKPLKGTAKTHPPRPIFFLIQWDE